MRIGIHSTGIGPESVPFMQRLFSLLQDSLVGLSIQSEFASSLQEKGVTLPEHHRFLDHEGLKEEIDMLFSIGGDGTFLSTLPLVRDSGIPVLGINTGRLGFLAYVSSDEIESSIGAVLDGRYSIKERSVLGIDAEPSVFGETTYALNEVAVHKKDSSSMMIIHIFADGAPLASYWADGIIVSTPTGSTGYNLSCGGPIAAPNVDCLIVTPKAPHNLTLRPIVLKDDVVLGMRVESRDDQFLLSMDSLSESCSTQTQVSIQKAGFPLRIVRPEGSSFFKTVREKLNWGADIRN